MVGMSVEGLKKLFERNCHKSFKTIQFEFRIAAAMEQLSTIDELITNIANDYNQLNAPKEVYFTKREEPFHSTGWK